jgi:hypothetical protein
VLSNEARDWIKPNNDEFNNLQFLLKDITVAEMGVTSSMHAKNRQIHTTFYRNTSSHAWAQTEDNIKMDPVGENLWTRFD